MRKKRISMYDASTFKVDYSKLNLNAETTSNNSNQECVKKTVGKVGKLAATPSGCVVYQLDFYRNK